MVSRIPHFDLEGTKFHGQNNSIFPKIDVQEI